MSLANDAPEISDAFLRETDLPQGLSEYEIQRRQKIERNHKKLQELGLINPQLRRAGIASTRQRPTPKATRRPAPAAGTAVAPVRRSQRTRGQVPPSYKESAVGFDERSVGARKRPRVSLDVAFPTGPTNTSSRDAIAAPVTKPQRVVQPKPGAPDSSRNLECDVQRLMEKHIGKRFAEFGKAAVMDVATKSVSPKFSKMSGVVEWKNAIFLWVNVGEESGGYTNLFETDTEPAARDGFNDGSASRNVPAKGGSGGPRSTSTALSLDDARGGAPKATVIASEDSSETSDENGGFRVSRRGDPSPGAGDSNVGTDATCTGVHDSIPARGACRGLRMTWFAGNRVTPESALVRRLIHAGSASATAAATGSQASPPRSSPNGVINEASEDRGLDDEMNSAATVSTVAITTTGSGTSSPDQKRAKDPSEPAPPETLGDGGSSEDTVLLFCRAPKEPYVFCGRLGYAMHWPDERPVRFAWRLLDSDRLSTFEDFRAILNAAADDVDGGAG